LQRQGVIRNTSDRSDDYSLWATPSYSNDHFTIGLVGFHRLMRLANIVESENPSRFCFVDACRHFIHDRLERNIRDWKVWSAEYKAAKESEVNSARHLQQRIEIIHRIKAA